jgi:preprotein translocase subunit SecG
MHADGSQEMHKHQREFTHKPGSNSGIDRGLVILFALWVLATLVIAVMLMGGYTRFLRPQSKAQLRTVVATSFAQQGEQV